MMSLKIKYSILLKRFETVSTLSAEDLYFDSFFFFGSGAANSFAIIFKLASQNEIGLPSAVIRFYRFLRNKRA
ncbi:MAG: hypothetical protein ACR2N3_04435 [Pyrinomonadaceae bacterium]